MIALVGEKSSYFIYGGHGDEYQLLLMVWVPIAGQKYPEGTLFCMLLEFDEGNIFRRYRIERHSVIWSDKQNISQCASTFFSKEELKSLSTGDTEVDYLLKMRLIEMAREGDVMLNGSFMKSILLMKMSFGYVEQQIKATQVPQ